MAYLKINGKDFSHIVKSLAIKKAQNYNAQTNAAGNTVVDYINAKRQIEVGIIYLNDADMKLLQNEVDKLSVTLSFRNPKTGALEEGVKCIIPDNEVDYYTIQADKVMYKETKLKFIEL